MQPRYFVGVTLPAELSREIEAVQQDLFVPGNVMEPLVPHITLLSPNHLESLAPSYIIPIVEKVARARLPVVVNLGKTALFDQRVLYISASSPELVELQSELVKLLPDRVRAMYEVGRRFVPHVTLAQAKPKKKLAPELIDQYRALIDSLMPRDFTANHLTQFTRTHPRIYRLKQL